jgi:FixJ family two-component response regulator
MVSKEPVVFILDINEVSRQSIIAIIHSAGIKTKSFSNPRTFLDTYEPAWSGCLITDIPMPEISGLELQKQLLARKINLPIIFLTAFADIPTAVEAMKMGAFDYLEKPARPQVLLDCIYRAIAHDKAQREIHAFHDEIQKRYGTLTSREKEVMESVVRGLANKVIALKLHLSQKTVEFHRANVMKKMEAQSLAELIHLNCRLMQPRENPSCLAGLPPFSPLEEESMQ